MVTIIGLKNKSKCSFLLRCDWPAQLIDRTDRLKNTFDFCRTRSVVVIITEATHQPHVYVISN